MKEKPMMCDSCLHEFTKYCDGCIYNIFFTNKYEKKEERKEDETTINDSNTTC